MSYIYPGFTLKGCYPEDFNDESGMYCNSCYKCKLIFYGHKRRMVCKLCYKQFNEIDTLLYNKMVDSIIYEKWPFTSFQVKGYRCPDCKGVLYIPLGVEDTDRIRCKICESSHLFKTSL